MFGGGLLKTEYFWRGIHWTRDIEDWFVGGGFVMFGGGFVEDGILKTGYWRRDIEDGMFEGGTIFLCLKETSSFLCQWSSVVDRLF